jgi:hypothetical protein
MNAHCGVRVRWPESPRRARWCLAHHGGEPAHPHLLPPDLRSWLNLVEIWFGIIERQVIHRGTFASVRELMIKIVHSSTAETTAAMPPSGPRSPTRSSRKPTVKTTPVAVHKGCRIPILAEAPALLRTASERV